MPMALTNDVLVAVGEGSDSMQKVSVVNIDSVYPKETFNIGAVNPDGKWHNYVACGVKGAVEDMSLLLPKSIRMAVDGNIPCASGLSSSSALVCSSALATYKIQEITTGTPSVPSRLHIASVCCKSERYIGTMGGGMDQVALSASHKKGCNRKPARTRAPHQPPCRGDGGQRARSLRPIPARAVRSQPHSALPS